MNHYRFNNTDTFYTLKKDYRLQLQKTNSRIQISKNVQVSDRKNEYRIDRTKIRSRMITANDVHNQLGNIKNIGFEVTDSCNLKCIYCTYRDLYENYDTRRNQYIDTPKAKMLVDFLFEKLNTPLNNSLRNEVTISFYGGEPLLNMDFITEMVSYTKNLENDRIKCRYNMTTNGVLLRKYLSFFIQNNFEIMVSLDGSKENDAHRLLQNGNPSFDIIYENMLYIRDHYPVFFYMNIRFNSVIHNLNNRKEVFSFFQREFNKTPSFSMVNDVGVKSKMIEKHKIISTLKHETPDEKTENEMKRIMDLNYTDAKNLEKFIFLISGNIYNTYNHLLSGTNDLICLSSGTCLPFSRRIFMTVNNKLLPCEKTGHQFSFGMVSENGVDINCEEVAHKFNCYCESLRKLCSRCYHVGLCSVCMYAIKNFDKEAKLECKSFVNKAEFDRLLHKDIEQLSQTPELYQRIMEEVVKF